MLVLTRKPGESIQVGESIVVKVVSVRGDKVRIGFEAPRDVVINRSEIDLKIKENERGERNE